MNSRKQMIINIAGFQIGWFSCVLMAVEGIPSIGILIALLIVLLHIMSSSNRNRIIAILAITCLAGSMWDSLLINLGIFEFSSSNPVAEIVPVWIMAMWLVFATTLNVSLRWLYNRYWLAMLLGAIAGPAAYHGGAALGGMTITGGINANLIIAAGWSIILPALIYVTQTIESKHLTKVVYK